MGNVDWESMDMGVFECELAVKRIFVAMQRDGLIDHAQQREFIARLRAAMPDVRHLAERGVGGGNAATCRSLPAECCGRCGGEAR